MSHWIWRPLPYAKHTKLTTITTRLLPCSVFKNVHTYICTQGLHSLYIVKLIFYLVLFTTIRFIKRLCNFYKPSNHLYSVIVYSEEHSRKYSSVGKLLVKYLCRAEDVCLNLSLSLSLSLSLLSFSLPHLSFMYNLFNIESCWLSLWTSSRHRSGVESSDCIQANCRCV